ncbi:MAG TPA: hypothetical protein VJI73_03430 [Candidatus Paceibacterota bacterium]
MIEDTPDTFTEGENKPNYKERNASLLALFAEGGIFHTTETLSGLLIQCDKKISELETLLLANPLSGLQNTRDAVIFLKNILESTKQRLNDSDFSVARARKYLSGNLTDAVYKLIEPLLKMEETK